jgi:prepilin-type N-terminal cleavage/methylation domain-containing protein
MNADTRRQYNGTAWGDQHRQGFSLIEVLVTVTIIGIISVTIGLVVDASTRLWQNINSRTLAFPPAYAALTRISADLRNAAWVWSPTDTSTREDWIVVYAPMVDTSDSTRQAARVNAVPLAVKLTNVHTYYLSDSTGEHTNYGTYLWMQTFNETATGAITQTDRRILASNVQSISFQTNRDTTRMYSVYSMALTVVGEDISTSPEWQASTAYTRGMRVLPPSASGKHFLCTTSGTSGTVEPTWPQTAGSTLTDGTVRWQEAGTAYTSQFSNTIAFCNPPADAPPALPSFIDQ